MAALRPLFLGAVLGSFFVLTGCGGGSSSMGTVTVPPAALSATISPTTLTFPVTTVGSTSAAQTVTLTNNGTSTLTLSGSATNALFPLQSTTCAATLAAGASCTGSIVFAPTGSGAATTTFTFNTTATSAPQPVNLTGTGTATAAAAGTNDCSVSGNTCPALALQGDPIAAGGFHGYADPSMRKDPNSSTIYLAYSWAKTLADGTHVVDLHLASSANGGTTFSEVGPLYQSAVVNQVSSTAYSTTNDSSTETVDLLPIALAGTSAGQTLWVQAHQSYLVAPMGGIYDQLNPTNIISVTAVQLATPGAAGAGTALLALSAANTPEARLGAVSTDPTRNVTQSLPGLTTATSKCGNFGQPALWYQTGTLYLALECTEITGNGNIDGNELAHFLYSTTPSGTDASKWVWAYVGEFATGAQAAKLGTTTAENTTYAFFTEPEFVMTTKGLAILATPGVFAPQTSTQPVIQYGCRVIPVTLTPTSISLSIDGTTGAPVVISKITENDLYTGVNEGPAACTYEPAANTGVVIGRKYENDPTYGFYIYPVDTGIFP